jgi:hypothetical protein
VYVNPLQLLSSWVRLKHVHTAQQTDTPTFYVLVTLWFVLRNNFTSLSLSIVLRRVNDSFVQSPILSFH